MAEYVSKIAVDFDTSGISKAISMFERLGVVGDQVERKFDSGSQSLATASRAASDLSSSGNNAANAVDNLATSEVKASTAAKTLSGNLTNAAGAAKSLADSSNVAASAAANVAASAGRVSNDNAKLTDGFNKTAKAAKLTTSELLNVGYQLNDLGVQVASGQNPLVALVQQGAQLQGIFAQAGARGVGFGAVLSSIGGAAAGVVSALAPLILIVGGVVGAFALFHRELSKGVPDDLTKGLGLTEKQLEKVTSKTVTMADTFQATFEIIGENIMNGPIGKALDWLGDRFTEVMDWVTKAGLMAATSLVAGFSTAYRMVVEEWRQLPGAFLGIFLAVNNSINAAIELIINTGIKDINNLIKAVNAIPFVDIPEIKEVNFGRSSNEAASKAGKVAGQIYKEEFEKTAAGFDLFGKQVAARSVDIRLKKIAKEVGDASKDAESASIPALNGIQKAADDLDKSMESLAAVIAKPFTVLSAEVKKSNASMIASINSVGPTLKRLQSLTGGTVGVAMRRDQLLAEDLATANRYGTQVAITAEYVKQLDLRAKQSVEEERAKNIEKERLKSEEQRFEYLTKSARELRLDFDLTDSFDQFFDDIPKKGADAFKDLFANIGDSFTQFFSDAMKEALDPFTSALKQQLSGVFKEIMGSFGSNGQSGSGILGSLGSLFGGGKAAAGGTATGASAGMSAAAMAGVVAAAGLAAYTIGDAIQKTINKNADKTSQAVSKLGVVGAVLAAVFGSDTNAAASQLLDKSGATASGVLGTKRTSETESALNAAVSSIQSGYAAISDLGGKISTYVENLEIGQRDASKIDLSNGTQLRTAVGDSAAASSAALIAVLKDTYFSSDVLNSLKDAMIGAGQDATTTLTTLSEVSTALGSVINEEVSEWQSKLDALHEAFDPLIEKTAAFTDANNALKDALSSATEALAASFNEDIRGQLMQLTKPLAYQLEELVKTQVDRMKDAVALGADIAQVTALNSAEFKDFLGSIDLTSASFTSLDTILADLQSTAAAAGQDVAALTSSFNQAKQTLIDTFDEDISDQMLSLANPTLASLETLLEQQKQRLASAKALGANVVAVERLNALEMKDFFSSLSDEQKLALGDYLGVIEDYTGKIAVVLSGLTNELTARIDNMEASRTALLESASNLRSLAETIKGTRESIVDQYSGATPMARIAALRSQFGEVAASAMSGDQAAAEKLPDLANKLIELSRSMYGSTTQFTSDYDLVTRLLGQTESALGDQATSAESQAETLLKQLDVLTQISETLNSSDANFDFLANAFGELNADNKAVKDLLGQYLDLNAAQNSAFFSDAQLQQLSQWAASQYVNSAPTTATTQAQPTNSSGVVTTSGQTTAAANDSDALVAYQIDVLQAGFDELNKNQKQLSTDFRNLSEYLRQTVE